MADIVTQKSFVVAEPEAGERLDRVLARNVVGRMTAIPCHDDPLAFRRGAGGCVGKARACAEALGSGS